MRRVYQPQSPVSERADCSKDKRLLGLVDQALKKYLLKESHISKAYLEKITPEFGSSFRILQYQESGPVSNKAFWHFHPELELVYVRGGNGKRHIGSHQSWFHNGDLLLIGSNLPHRGFTDRLTGNKSETVVQMKRDFLGPEFFKIPEMQPVKQMFDRAGSAIGFGEKIRNRVGSRLEGLINLAPYDRLMGLLAILKELAETNDYNLLNADGLTFEIEQQDNDRSNVIFKYVEDHYSDQISLDEIAAEVNMTVPAFCRYFKKISGKTFTRFVNEYRVVEACKLLLEQPFSITEVCFKSGFNNFSHFNRLFKEITGKSPSAYRKDSKVLMR